VPPTSAASGADAIAEIAPTPPPRAAELRQRAGGSSTAEAPAQRRLREQERSAGFDDGRLGRVDAPAPPGPPPPAAAAPAPAPEQPKSQPAPDEFAPPPANVVAAAEKLEVQSPRESEAEDKADTAGSERAAGLAAGSANAGVRPLRKAAGTLEERDAAAHRKEGAPTTVEEARRARDAWRAVARNRAGTAEGDEARVRAIESSLLAWRLGHDPADLEAARTEGRAYLVEPAAPQKDRVRRALAGASAPPR
jgi:hypothetical protein